MKSPFKPKSHRRRRHEQRQLAKFLDKHGERLQIAAIGGGVILVAVMVAKVLIR